MPAKAKTCKCGCGALVSAGREYFRGHKLHPRVTLDLDKKPNGTVHYLDGAVQFIESEIHATESKLQKLKAVQTAIELVQSNVA